LIAVSSPLRREILKVLRKGSASIEQLQNATKLERATLEWHLSILEHGFCIEKVYAQARKYKLTQEGKVVDYIG
jgi:DNA-binding transcriptional ArsR family regulator